MKALRLVALVLPLLLAAACGREDPPPPAARDGRAETQSIRNTQAVGTGGAAIAGTIDGALDANDAHVQQVERAADADAPPPE